MNLNTGSQNMHPISLTHYEHQVAPRLEQDIYKLYLSICFKRGGEYDAQFWRSHLFEYFLDWSQICLMPTIECGYWINYFRMCFHASQRELNVVGLNLTLNQQEAEQLIDLILVKLRKIFSAPSFLEMIEDKNVKHAKRVEHYQKAYQQATKHHHVLNKINLFLGYLPGYTSVTSIFNVAKDIRQFELLLGQYGYFPFDYLFQYQRVVQLAENGEYGMLFSLTLNGYIYQDNSALLLQIARLWNFVTKYRGMVVNLNEAITEHSHPFTEMFAAFNDVSDFERLVQQDFFNVDADSMNVRIWPNGFRRFHGKGSRQSY
ncbi:hypothetical protein ACT40Y_01755 [Acinetobacter baumannii]|nr:hypothetical protein [Acinetobacter baumannii]